MQVPSPFAYSRATSVQEALTLLAEHGPDARLVAGGHSLLPMMKLRLADPSALIDIGGIDGLDQIVLDGDEMSIGARVTHTQVLESELVAEHLPILTEAERLIADPVVRNRGTVGGSLCHADPAEDLSVAFAALRASVVIIGATGTRRVPVRDFHAGPYETAVGEVEMVTEIRIPLRAGGSGAYEKVKRRVGDWAVAAAGVAVWLEDESITEIGVGLAAVGAEHLVATAAEDAARGRRPTAELVEEVGELAAAASNPATDQRGPADYKRHLAGELTKRALRRSLRNQGALR